jgi:hypothetical protein
MAFPTPLKSSLKNLKIGSKIDNNEANYHEVNVWT